MTNIYNIHKVFRQIKDRILNPGKANREIDEIQHREDIQGMIKRNPENIKVQHFNNQQEYVISSSCVQCGNYNIPAGLFYTVCPDKVFCNGYPIYSISAKAARDIYNEVRLHHNTRFQQNMERSK